ncbi:MAG: LysM domain-containing protein [Patescibacteria group bacterium]|jgi:LysM repeat protein
MNVLKLVAALCAAIWLSACAPAAAPTLSVAPSGGGQTPPATAAVAAQVVPQPTAQPQPTKTASICAKRHKVLSGETLLGIAQAESVSLASLVRINGIDNANYVEAGRNLCIPATFTVPTKKSGTNEHFSLGSVAECSRIGAFQRIWLKADAYSLEAVVGNPPLDNRGQEIALWKWSAQKGGLVVTVEFYDGNNQIRGYQITSQDDWVCVAGDNFPLMP